MDPSLDKDTWMLKLDCDTFLYDNFFSSHPQLENTIYSGDYQLARNENEMHLNGVLYARLSHFLAVNGYDERIQTYGWDDDNLYQRLNQRGHVHLPIDTDELFHMAHSNFRRTAAQAIEHGEAVEIQINRMISEQVEPWNKTQSGLDFSPQDMDGQGGIVIQHRPPSLRALISGDEYQKVERNAMIFVLRKLGMPVHLQSFPAAYMDRLLVTLTKANHRPMLTLHAQYDLGSRLRSLLSAIIIAQKTKVFFFFCLYIPSGTFELYGFLTSIVGQSLLICTILTIKLTSGRRSTIANCNYQTWNDTYTPVQSLKEQFPIPKLY